MGRFSFVIIFCIVFLGIIISTAKGQTSSSCLDLSQEFSNSGCVSDLNNLRREGSSNAACTGRCRELINSLFDCGTDSVSLFMCACMSVRVCLHGVCG